MKKILVTICAVAFFAIASNAQDTKTCDKAKATTCCAKKADAKTADAKTCTKDTKTCTKDAKACPKTAEATKDKK